MEVPPRYIQRVSECPLHGGGSRYGQDLEEVIQGGEDHCPRRAGVKAG